ALRVHVDPSEVVTVVALDDEVFSAGDDERFARRSAATVSRLTLRTSTIPALAVTLRADAREAPQYVVRRLEEATAGLARGDTARAHGILATSLDELRLVLLLDEHTLRLAGGTPLTSQEELTPVAEDLLAAQSRGDGRATQALLAERLLPLLRGW